MSRANFFVELIKNNNVEELQKQIKNQPGIARSFMDVSGRTLLMLASGYGAYECVKILIHHSNVDALDCCESNALNYAVFNNRIDVANLLLEHNPNLLHMNISEDDAEDQSIIRFLLSRRHPNQGEWVPLFLEHKDRLSNEDVGLLYEHRLTSLFV
jgi:ankyrin repeat protein